jgi:hypothetical protein
MLMKLRSRLTYANVMATLAVFISLGGTSYAVARGSIGSREIKNNAVTSTDLKNNGIRGTDLRNNTVAGVDVKNDGLTGADVLESSLGTVPSANAAGAANTANRASAANTADRASTADLASNIAAPEAFHEVGAAGEPQFNTGCANDAINPLLQSAGFYKDREGVVHLKGSFTCTGAGVIAFNLPPGYRPPSGKLHAQAAPCQVVMECGSGTSFVAVFGSGLGGGNDGGVAANGTTRGFLDGITFRAAS